MTQSGTLVGPLNQVGELSQAGILDSSVLVKQLPREKLEWMLEKMCQTRYFE